MSDFVPVKESQISICSKFPLYCLSDDGEPILYKNKEDKLDDKRLSEGPHPPLFINKKDEASIIKELQAVLNLNFAKSISSEGIDTIKDNLCRIVDEALSEPSEDNLSSLPETIEILLYGAKKSSDFLDALTSIKCSCPILVEHSVNVLSFTMQYAISKQLSDEDIRKFSLCALLHDIGFTKIDKNIFETDKKLTDKQFITWKTHTTRGFNLMELYPDFDKSVAKTVLQHHERLDGSGYPDGTKIITFEAQVIGLVCSYDHLSHREKNFRKALKPYNALQIIKEDVIKSKYNKKVFIDLCSCLNK